MGAQLSRLQAQETMGLATAVVVKGTGITLVYKAVKQVECLLQECRD